MRAWPRLEPFPGSAGWRSTQRMRKADAAGIGHARELLYGRRMSAMLERFAPDASEVVRLWPCVASTSAAGRSHAIVSRAPRTGTRRGARALRTSMPPTAARMLREAGYDEETVARPVGRAQGATEAGSGGAAPGERRRPRVPRTLPRAHHYRAPGVRRGEAGRHPAQKALLKMSPRGRAAPLFIARLPEALPPVVVRRWTTAPLTGAGTAAARFGRAAQA